MPKLFLNKIQLLLILLASLYGLISLWIIRDYLYFSFLPLSMLVLYFFIAQVEIQQKQTNYSNLILSLIFLVLFINFQSKSFLFFSFLFFFLELHAHYRGRMRKHIIFLFFFCSPLFSFLGKLLGFPLRMQLTKYAAQLLSYSHEAITLVGNSIMINGADFIVDEACSGLNMLFASMIWGFIVLEIHSIKYKKNCSLISQGLYYLTVLMLNLAGNLSRITLLILFKIYPESSMHQILGLTAFVLYSMIPVYFVSKIWALYFGHSHQNSKPIQINERFSSSLLMGFSCLGVLLLLYNLLQSHPQKSILPLNIPSSYSKQIVNSDVTKYYSSTSLIYIKTMNSCLSGEHSPLICWVGSGYEAKKFVEIERKGIKLYTGILEKGHHKFYTAWYYSNGHFRTNSPWLWRVEALKSGGNFYLVNLTSASSKELDLLIDDLLLKI